MEIEDETKYKTRQKPVRSTEEIKRSGKRTE
jgi:hypothetical protein